eukprot:8675447-Pyramimonas_sp.AAC.2
MGILGNRVGILGFPISGVFKVWKEVSDRLSIIPVCSLPQKQQCISLHIARMATFAADRPADDPFAAFPEEGEDLWASFGPGAAEDTLTEAFTCELSELVPTPAVNNADPFALGANSVPASTEVARNAHENLGMTATNDW